MRALASAIRACSPLNSLRHFSAAAIAAATEVEKAIAEKLNQGLNATSISVQDTSGGCGAMYSIDVVAEDFTGKSIVKQHQMVTKLIQDDIKQWHGFQLTTKAPSS
jgi:stress-induced morphogen